MSCFVRNVGHFHNCKYSNLSDRLYRITTVKPGNYWLKAYARFVTDGSYCLVQDGVIDQLAFYRKFRPGPLPAIERFLAENRDFVVDTSKCKRYLVTHHPKGWLKRV